MSTPLSPEISAIIDRVLSELESSIPGVSKDTQVRSEVETAVGAAVSSLDHLVPEATETATRSSLGDMPDVTSWQVPYELSEAAKKPEHVFEAAEATRQVIEKMGRAAVEPPVKGA
jgi:hypothetical protein